MKPFMRISGLASFFLSLFFCVPSSVSAFEEGPKQKATLAITLPDIVLGSFTLPPDIQVTQDQLRELVGALQIRQTQSLSLAGHQEINDAVITALRTFAELKELDLRETGIHDAGVFSLSSLRGLQRLDLSNTMVGNDGLRALKELQSLRQLYLRATQVDDAGLAALKDLKRLHELDLNGTDIKGKGLVNLAGLPLETLDLGETKLSGTSVYPLHSIQSLEILHLNNTRIDNEGLATLRWLPHLRLLNVSCTDVTDSALEPFRRHPGFESLNVCPDR
ncbi:MAG: hypothetical protein WC859_03785 [Elusimicrobiota bacterium]|jgi:hypothetical protein